MASTLLYVNKNYTALTFVLKPLKCYIIHCYVPQQPTLAIL